MSERIAVLGHGVSGRAAAQLAAAQGHEVEVFDERGGGTSRVFDRADLARFDAFVVSPGFAETHPWRRLAAASGKPCYGEFGFAARHWKGSLYGVTGTNGKSTLTGLVAAALDRAGTAAIAAGNIGEPLSDFIVDERNREATVAVCEISSFQAELPRGIRLDGLLWTNFAEDHLDRYASMADYFAAKARLFDCLKKDAPCVLGPQVTEWMEAAQKFPATYTLAYEDEPLLAHLSERSPFRRLPHSRNISLAAAFFRLLALPMQPLIESADHYTLAPHRLDVIDEWGGVRFWNDAKATNFQAALAAVAAVAAVEGPTVWVGGGRSKGGDAAAFARLLAPQVEAAFVFGEVGRRLADDLSGHLAEVAFFPQCPDAIRAAVKAAQRTAPSNVLFSPGFTSFDQFGSYAERGKCFADTVLSLKQASLTQ